MPHTAETWAYSDDRYGTLWEAAVRGTVIWDWDGTVADTEPLHLRSLEEQMAAYGFTPPAGWFERNMGQPSAVTWAWLRDEHGAPVQSIDAWTAETNKRYARIAEAELTLGWFAADMIPMLDDIGVDQFLLSNGDYDINSRLAESFEVADRLTMIRRETESKEPEMRKLLTDRRCLLFDDRQHYLDIGREHYAFTIAVQHPLGGSATTANLTVTL